MKGRQEKRRMMTKLKGKSLNVLLTAFVATVIILAIMLKGDVNKVEAEESKSAFSYQDIRGKIGSNQTLIVPSLDEMAKMGLDVKDDRNHAMIQNTGTLEIAEGGTLIVPSGVVLLVNGTIVNKGTIIVEDYGAILGTPKHDQGVYGFTYWYPQQKLNSTLSCVGGRLIIEEKATVYLSREVSVSNGGYIVNDGVLMAGNSINVDNSCIQTGSNSQIYVGYYFMDMLKTTGTAAVATVDVLKPLSVSWLNSYYQGKAYYAAEERYMYNNRITVLKNDQNGRTKYENLGEAVYYISREAKLSDAFDEQNPFLAKDNKTLAALMRMSVQSKFVDYVKPKVNTINGGSVNMEKGALMFVAHKPLTDLKLNKWPNTDLFEQEVGTEDGKINLIINDNGIMREASRKLLTNHVTFEYSFLSNHDYYLFY